ncbi:MAG: hypothetical protein K9M08_14740 [Pirellula sp.]|nr:hypothetical protein [Pirellula sp.]
MKLTLTLLTSLLLSPVAALNPLIMKTTSILRNWIAVLTMSGSALLAAEPSAGNATNQPTPQGAKNVVVFAEPGSFAGWPATKDKPQGHIAATLFK